VETLEDAGDSGTEGALGFWPVAVWVELPADVAILEAEDGVLTAEDCAEDIEVFEVDGIEAA